MLNFAPPTRPSIPEISLVPMVNIVFLLLFFFVVAGKMESRSAMSVALPVSMKGENGLDEAPTELVFSAEAQILLDEEPLSQEELEAWLSRYTRSHRHPSIILRADASLQAKKLVRLIHQLQAAGVAEVSLLTQME